MQDVIRIRGARENNLANINVDIPRDKLVVFTGLSGSGKSSLAFDTLYAEGQRRYVESLSAYARQFLGQMQKPDVDQIDGLSPVSLDQKLFAKLVEGREQDEVVAIAEFAEQELLTDTKILADRVIVLDGVQDPGNLGNIFRTAAAFGFTDIISLPGTARLSNPKVWRAAAGSIAAINFYRASYEEFARFIENSKYKLVLADIAGENLNTDMLADIKSKPFALTLGSEGHGASVKVRELCDISIKIPYSDQAESLNVAVAAGILIYNLSEFS